MLEWGNPHRLGWVTSWPPILVHLLTADETKAFYIRPQDIALRFLCCQIFLDLQEHFAYSWPNLVTQIASSYYLSFYHLFLQAFPAMRNQS